MIFVHQLEEKRAVETIKLLQTQEDKVAFV
jgi:hypothetical protein